MIETKQSQKLEVPMIYVMGLTALPRWKLELWNQQSSWAAGQLHIHHKPWVRLSNTAWRSLGVVGR
jgi:hypothetical protein